MPENKDALTPLTKLENKTFFLKKYFKTSMILSTLTIIVFSRSIL